MWQTHSKHYPQWWKMKSISPKVRNKTRASTLTTTIQHSFGSVGHSNQGRKGNKKNPDRKRRSKALTCRWHDPLHAADAAAGKSLQSCPTLCNHINRSHQAPLSLRFSRQEHWSGLPFLLQCMKVKSESEVAQSCPTLSIPMDCSLPGSSVYGIFKARVLEWVASVFFGSST